MGRQLNKNPDGRFGVTGMNCDNQDEKLYACVCKLKAYEETGLSPDEVERLNTFVGSELERQLGRFQAMTQEKEKYELLLFMTVRMKVMVTGLELGKTETEINQMALETMKEMFEMANWSSVKEIYNSVNKT